MFDTTIPRMIGLSRLGVHFRPTRLVLTFNRPLEETAAQVVANSRILRPNGRRGHVTRSVSDASNTTVILTLARRLKLHRVYTLAVNGQRSTGLTSASGSPLGGSDLGQASTDFVTEITRRALGSRGATPAVTFVSSVAQRLSMRGLASLSRLVGGVARPGHFLSVGQMF